MVVLLLTEGTIYSSQSLSLFYYSHEMSCHEQTSAAEESRVQIQSFWLRLKFEIAKENTDIQKRQQDCYLK